MPETPTLRYRLGDLIPAYNYMYCLILIIERG